MMFYALRIVCRKCGAPSLLGGSAKQNLTRWRESVLECHGCGAETSAADGESIGLAALAGTETANRVEDSPRA